MARDFRDADHLPNRAADRQPPTPPACRASAAGSRRRCTAATPTTTCSPDAGHWDPVDPRRRAARASSDVPAAAVLHAARVRAACARSATSCSPRTPSRGSRCSSFVDAKLARRAARRLPARGHARRPRDLAAGRPAASTRPPARTAPSASRSADEPMQRRDRRRLRRRRARRAASGTSCRARRAWTRRHARGRWRRSTRTRGRGTRSASAARPTRAATCACGVGPRREPGEARGGVRRRSRSSDVERRGLR